MKFNKGWWHPKRILGKIESCEAEKKWTNRFDALERRHAECIDGSPHNEAARGIAPVGSEPRVEARRIHAHALGRKHHRNRRHRTARRANRVAAARPKLLRAPLKKGSKRV